jgi:hypothetical protein
MSCASVKNRELKFKLQTLYCCHGWLRLLSCTKQKIAMQALYQDCRHGWTIFGVATYLFL